MPEYRKVTVDDLPDAPNPSRHKKEIDEAVGASRFGFNVYVGDPGELIPWGYHSHPDHEELFYVLEGQLTVDTPDGEYTVAAGEVFYVPDDAPHGARVSGAEPARLVAVGAPKDADWGTIKELCEQCGETTELESARDGDQVTLTCAACSAVIRQFGPGPAGH